MNAFVINQLHYSHESTDANGNFVWIKGRAGGLMSWFLNLFGISPTLSVAMRANRFHYEMGSVSGFVRCELPLENINATESGFRKPIREALVLGTVVGVLTWWLAFIPGVIFAIVYYSMNKRLTIAVTDLGGRSYEFAFKSSLVDGKPITYSTALEICELIQARAGARRLEMRQGDGDGPRALPPPARQTPAVPESTNQPQLAAATKQATGGAARPSRGTGANRLFFYADSANKVVGPFKFETLSDLEERGTLDAGTKVIEDGQSEWTTWSDLKKLAR